MPFTTFSFRKKKADLKVFGVCSLAIRFQDSISMLKKYARMMPTMKLNMNVEKEVREATNPDKKATRKVEAFPAN
ncbi:hypothetical protein D3C85_1568720 [compost metagenome]